MAKSKKMDFEIAINRLEEVLSEMEKDNLPLDKLLANFSEGVGLLENCRKQLDDAQAQLEKLSSQE